MTNEKSRLSKKLVLVLAGCGSILLIALCLGLVFVSFARSLVVFIQPTERGVVISAFEPTGYRTETLEPGYHILLPGEAVVVYEISRQKYEMSASSGEKPDSIRAITIDDKEVFVDISVVYAVDPENILDMHLFWQDRYHHDLVRPMSRGVTRNVIEQYIFDEMVSMRAEIQQGIFDELETGLREHYIILVDVTLIDIAQASE